MSRGIRNDTLERIQAARDKDPLALGPVLGLLCVEYNLPATLVATFIGAHQQTVSQWFFGIRDVAPHWSTRVLKLIGVLNWMHQAGKLPLVGNAEWKTARIKDITTTYGKLARGGR